MTPKRKIVISDSTSPYENLAIEKYLTANLGEDEIVLFLWRNDDTVVIGRNQNCWRECKVSEILANGGRIARRLSGGGAVYHDSGNLNFSFIYPDGKWTVSDGLSIIALACRNHGIDASVSGRNDILTNGAKFSGNAFFSLNGNNGQKNHCHHGCILISTDTSRMELFLNVSKAKLESKGVRSVRSRVVNLGSLAPHLTPDLLSESLSDAFGGEVFPVPDSNEIKKDAEHLASDEWIFGRQIDFTDSFGARFPWGEITLNFKVSAGTVTECKIYSDSMDEHISTSLESDFVGKQFLATALGDSITVSDATVKNDICELLLENI
jgi:lipoate-protein ligase A